MWAQQDGSSQASKGLRHRSHRLQNVDIHRPKDSEDAGVPAASRAHA